MGSFADTSRSTATAAGSLELMREAKRLADEAGTVFHQHQSFMPADAGFDAKRFGKPALVHFAEKGILGPNTIFTHMNVLDDAEVEAIAKSGMGLVWHPGNFMYYGISQQAKSRFPELARRGTPITFGTDVAKVWAFGELGFIAYLFSREWGDFVPSDVPARDVHAGRRPCDGRVRRTRQSGGGKTRRHRHSHQRTCRTRSPTWTSCAS